MPWSKLLLCRNSMNDNQLFEYVNNPSDLVYRQEKDTIGLPSVFFDHRSIDQFVARVISDIKSGQHLPAKLKDPNDFRELASYISNVTRLYTDSFKAVPPSASLHTVINGVPEAESSKLVGWVAANKQDFGRFSAAMNIKAIAAIALNDTIEKYSRTLESLGFQQTLTFLQDSDIGLSKYEVKPKADEPNGFLVSDQQNVSILVPNIQTVSDATQAFTDKFVKAFEDDLWKLPRTLDPAYRKEIKESLAKAVSANLLSHQIRLEKGLTDFRALGEQPVDLKPLVQLTKASEAQKSLTELSDKVLEAGKPYRSWFSRLFRPAVDPKPYLEAWQYQSRLFDQQVRKTFLKSVDNSLALEHAQFLNSLLTPAVADKSFSSIDQLRQFAKRQNALDEQIDRVSNYSPKIAVSLKAAVVPTTDKEHLPAYQWKGLYSQQQKDLLLRHVGGELHQALHPKMLKPLFTNKQAELEQSKTVEQNFARDRAQSYSEHSYARRGR